MKRRMTRINTRMMTRMTKTRMTRARMIMVNRHVDMWVGNILMGRTMRKRLRTRRMMMGDRDNIWAGEDFANMWRARFHREIDQTGLPCGDATNKFDSEKEEILLLNFRKSYCCLGNPISGVGIGSKVERLV